MHTTHRGCHDAAALSPRSEGSAGLVPGVVLGDLGIQPLASIGIPPVEVEVCCQGALGQRPPSNETNIVVVLEHDGLVALLMNT